MLSWLHHPSSKDFEVDIALLSGFNPKLKFRELKNRTESMYENRRLANFRAAAVNELSTIMSMGYVGAAVPSKLGTHRQPSVSISR